MKGAEQDLEYKFLGKINSPSGLKQLNPNQLPLLCEEIRHKLIDTISKNGGHLASNLGAVELTVALHRVFDSPEDSIIFDTGHQSYTHKLLTGRFEKFDTIRKENGLSGFMRPQESPHDPFVTGHSSNSISAALGIARANSLLGKKGRVVAVIGDGAMTGGMAFEALNNAGQYKGNFIVVLNDNKMSISNNVGAIARHLNKIRTKPGYYRFKDSVEKTVKNIPLVGNTLRDSLFKSKKLLKGAIYKSNIFEELGFTYLGPVDGHNIKDLLNIFEIARFQNRPVLVHVVTTKGKGYLHAEKSPINFHGVPAFDIETGQSNGKKAADFSSECGRLLCEFAKTDSKLCAVTAAMTYGTGLYEFSRQFRQRFFDVGIAEQHAVTFCAGAASAGLRPVFVVYSSFLQRGYDQILHDAAIQKLPLKLCIDRAGIVGEDGETHQGVFDTAFLSNIPGVSIYSPTNFSDLKVMLHQALYEDQGISAVRYPRGGEPVLPDDYKTENKPYVIYGGGSETALVTYGRLFANACRARETLMEQGISIDIVKLNRIFPFEKNLISELKNYKRIYFFEEGIRSGGIAEHLSAELIQNDFGGKYKIIAIENKFVAQSTVESALKKFNLDSDSMVRIISGE